VCRRTCHFLRHDFGQKLLPPLWGGITAVSVRGQRGNDLSWEECFYSVAVRVRVAEKPVAVVMCWMNSGLCGVLANPLVSQEERVTTGCPTRHTPHMNS
jgi:hypothetical protein